MVKKLIRWWQLRLTNQCQFDFRYDIDSRSGINDPNYNYIYWLHADETWQHIHVSGIWTGCRIETVGKDHLCASTMPSVLFVFTLNRANFWSEIIGGATALPAPPASWSLPLLKVGLLQYDLFWAFPDIRPEINGGTYQK